MRRMGMSCAMVFAGVCWCATVMVGASGRGKERGFDGIVGAVNARYHLHGRRVPMMWMVSLAARAASHGGVRGMRVVTYEGLGQGVEREGLEEIVRAELGEDWSPMVRERSEAETSLVYVQPDRKWVRMIVVDLEEGELNLVRMEMRPEALAKWDEKGGQ